MGIKTYCFLCVKVKLMFKLGGYGFELLMVVMDYVEYFAKYFIELVK